MSTGRAYIVALGAVGATLLFQGAAPFRYDGHWLQWVEAALLLWLGGQVASMAQLPSWERALYGAGCAWLCMDEALMFHECARMKWSLRAFGMDMFVVLYGLCAIAVAVRLAVKHPARRAALPHFVVAGIAAAAVVLVDNGMFGRGATTHVIEETCELLAIAAAIAGLRASSEAPTPRAIGFVCFTAAWMFGAFWLVRPWVCPARLL